MRNDPLIPKLAVVTDIRVDTPDVKTFRVVGLSGKKPFEHIPGQCAMLAVPARSFSALYHCFAGAAIETERNCSYCSFAKNATTIAPGPTCVPMVLPMDVIGSDSSFPSQISRLAAIYS